MKLGSEQVDLDSVDRHILALVQENCRLSLTKIGDQVGLSAPAVIERVKKLEESGVIKGYRAILNARLLGLDVAAFIGVSIAHPRQIGTFEKTVEELEDVLECHHVTGGYTLILKVRTRNTSSLEELISRIRSIDGVDRTETMVVLSTHTERSRLALKLEDGAPPTPRRGRRDGGKQAVHLKGV